MSDEEKSNGGVCKKRVALGDVTNLDRKRGVYLISDDVSVKSDKKKGVQIAKQLCVGAGDMEEGNYSNNDLVNDNERGKRVRVSPCSVGDINSLTRGNATSGKSEVQEESKENNILVGNDQLVSGIDIAQSVFDASRDSCVSSLSVPTSPCNLDSLDIGDGVGVESQGEKSNILEQVDTSVGMNDENELGDDNLDSTTECYGFPESQESRSSGLERCVGLKGDGFPNPTSGIDLIKACSCSFCTKAAYIWSDLHYQDIKGRIAALKKSQREANILVQRSFMDKSIERHGDGNPEMSELQSNLVGQWRSLFIHMEDIFARESNQLESSLYTLNDMRESCKTELESLNGRPLEKQ